MSEFLNLLSEVKKYITLVKEDGLTVADVPLSYQSKKLQVAAVNQNAEAILLMPNPCKKACEEALLCNVKIANKLDKEIKKGYNLWSLERELKKSIKILDFNIDKKTNTASVFNCKDKNVFNIIIPKKFNGYFVRGIGFKAFTGCKKLETIEFPNTITKIRLDAFLGTPWLKEQRNKNSLVIINNILIDGSTASGNVIVPDGIIEIDDYAFENCKNLSSITILNNITKIGQYAFDSCNKLNEIIIPKTVKEINYGAFCDCSNLKLKVCGSKKDYPNWEDWGLSDSQIEWNYKPKAN